MIYDCFFSGTGIEKCTRICDRCHHKHGKYDSSCQKYVLTQIGMKNATVHEHKDPEKCRTENWIDFYELDYVNILGKQELMLLKTLKEIKMVRKLTLGPLKKSRRLNIKNSGARKRQDGKIKVVVVL